MENTVSHGVIAVIRDLLEADTVFFRVATVLPEPIRSRVIGNRARMTQDILVLMRTILEPPTPQRIVVNIPLRESDWQAATGNYEDVQVAPTAAQLAAALEHDVPVNDATCAICQEGMESGTRLRNCGHNFHAMCITNWFAMNPRCPVCRDDVREQRAVDPPAPNASAGGSRSSRG